MAYCIYQWERNDKAKDWPCVVVYNIINDPVLYLSAGCVFTNWLILMMTAKMVATGPCLMSVYIIIQRCCLELQLLECVRINFQVCIQCLWWKYVKYRANVALLKPEAWWAFITHYSFLKLRGEPLFLESTRFFKWIPKTI